MATQNASAAWGAASTMKIATTIVPGLASLWIVYTQAATTYEELRRRWHLIAPCARSDGSAGFLYTQIYTAEQAKDAAYAAWGAEYAKTNPAPNPGVANAGAIAGVI